MKRFLVLLCTMTLVLGLVGNAGAAIIRDQPWDSSSIAVASQDFGTSYADFTCSAYDDFSISINYYIDTLTVYGDDNGIYPQPNISVIGEIWDGLPDSGGSLVMPSIAGSEDSSGNLVIDFGGQLLTAGNYWISAYVERDFDTWGTQWYWYTTTPNTDSEAYWHNPGGAFGSGTSVITVQSSLNMTDHPFDMAFKLEGTPVPEPATMLLLGTGLVGLVGFRKKFIKA